MKPCFRLAAAIAGFWIFDALVHVLLLSNGAIIGQVLRPSLPEVYSRLAASVGLVCSVLLYQAMAARSAELSKEFEQYRSTESMYRTVFDQLGEGLAVRELVLDDDGKPVDYRYLDVNPAFEEITGLKKEQVIGKTARSLFPRLGEELIERFVTVATTGQPMRFEAYIEDLDKHFGYTVFSPGKMQFATLMIDVSERKRTEAVLRQTAFFESCIAEVAQTLVSKESDELGDVLEVVAGALDLDYCSVVELKDEKTVSRIQEWSGPEDPIHTHQFLGLDLSRFGVWHETLRRGECLLARNLSEHTSSALQEIRMVSDEGIKAFASVPIMLQGKLVGLLSVGARQEHVWSANEIGLLVTVSEIVATYRRRVQAERRMEYLTYHDTLTHVYNRTYFENRLLDALANRPVLSVIMGDLNGLKIINDRLGHAQGDQVIVSAAKALKAACGKEDVVIRWGGDEFVVIMPDADEQEADAACRKILSNCRSSSSRVEVSISLGHATRTDTGVSVRDLIKKAAGQDRRPQPHPPEARLAYSRGVESG